MPVRSRTVRRACASSASAVPRAPRRSLTSPSPWPPPSHPPAPPPESGPAASPAAPTTRPARAAVSGRRIRRVLYLLGAVGSGGFVLLQFLVPVWGGALGAPPAAVGLIAGIGSLLAALFTVPAGALVDRGKTRPVLASAA